MSEGAEIGPHSEVGIHEVSSSELAERTKRKVEEQYTELKKFMGPTRPQEEQRDDMLRTIGQGGVDAARELIPYLKDRFVDSREESSSPTELVVFSLVNDAVADDSQEDVLRTLDSLSEIRRGPEGINIALDPFRRAQEQFSATLVRQLSSIKEKDPNDPLLQTAAAKLNEIRNDPFTDRILRDSDLRLPLAVTGDEKAVQELGTIREQGITKYANRRFNLDTLKYEYENGAQEASYVDSETSQIISPNDLNTVENSSNDLSQPGSTEGAPSKEDLRDPNSLSSEDLPYDSGVSYEVPDLERLYHYLKYEYQKDGPNSPIGPPLAEGVGKPLVVYDQRYGQFILRLPMEHGRAARMSEIFAPRYLDIYKKRVKDTLYSDANSLKVEDKYSQGGLYKQEGRGVQAQIATISPGEISINVSNLTSGIDSPQNLGRGLRNALELFRVLETEKYKEKVLADQLHGVPSEPMKTLDIRIDPDFAKYQLAQAA